MTAPEDRIPVGVSLLELAERCEKATGPDHMLDAEIAIAALGWLEIPSPEADWRSFESPTGARANIQRKDGVSVFDHGPLAFFTASLDAAMTLVPEGCDWGSSRIFGPDGRLVGSAWVKSLGGKFVLAATPALALCAAALKARAAMVPNPPHEGER